MTLPYPRNWKARAQGPPGRPPDVRHSS